MTAFCDPGVIPARGEELKNEKQYRNWLSVNNLQVNKYKYCTSCMIIRPPRAVHCNDCNTCVMMMDHHCPWVGICVGRNNYHKFKMFINFLVLSIGWSLLAHLIEFYLLLNEES